jgi:hypothetical protein
VKLPSVLERDIMADIMIAITALPESHFERTNTGAARTSTGAVIRFNRPGHGDITGCLRGCYVEIETKTKTGALRKEQKHRKWLIERAGGRYIVARSVADALAGLADIP